MSFETVWVGHKPDFSIFGMILKYSLKTDSEQIFSNQTFRCFHYQVMQNVTGVIVCITTSCVLYYMHDLSCQSTPGIHDLIWCRSGSENSTSTFWDTNAWYQIVVSSVVHECTKWVLFIEHAHVLFLFFLKLWTEWICLQLMNTNVSIVHSGKCFYGMTRARNSNNANGTAEASSYEGLLQTNQNRSQWGKNAILCPLGVDKNKSERLLRL